MTSFGSRAWCYSTDGEHIMCSGCHKTYPLKQFSKDEDGYTTDICQNCAHNSVPEYTTRKVENVIMPDEIKVFTCSECGDLVVESMMEKHREICPRICDRVFKDYGQNLFKGTPEKTKEWLNKKIHSVNHAYQTMMGMTATTKMSYSGMKEFARLKEELLEISTNWTVLVGETGQTMSVSQYLSKPENQKGIDL